MIEQLKRYCAQLRLSIFEELKCSWSADPGVAWVLAAACSPPRSARLRYPPGSAARAARDVVGARRAEKHVVGVRRGQTTIRRSQFPACRQQRLRRAWGGAPPRAGEAPPLPAWRRDRRGQWRCGRRSLYQRRSVRPRMKAAWPACSRSSVSTLIRRTAMVTGGSQCRSTIVSMSASVRLVTNSTVCSYVASW